MNKKAVIYSRVSTNDQTIENQLQLLLPNLAEATEDLKESIGKKGKYGISKKRRRDATEWNTGHRIEEVDNTVMNFDHIISKSSTGKFHTDNQDTIKKLQAMKHLDNVAKGNF